MKYAVVSLQNGQQVPIQNPYAMGNWWFVDEVILVDTPDEECDMIDDINLHSQAVADKRFADELDITKPETTTMMAFDEENIELTSYAPNCLEYTARNECNKISCKTNP